MFVDHDCLKPLIPGSDHSTKSRGSAVETQSRRHSVKRGPATKSVLPLEVKMIRRLLTILAAAAMIMVPAVMAQQASQTVTMNVNLNGGCQWTWSTNTINIDAYFPYTLRWISSEWINVDYSFAFPAGVYPKIVMTPTEFIPALGGTHSVVDSLTYGFGTGWNGHVITPGGFPGGAGVAKTVWEELTDSTKTQPGAKISFAFQTFANSTVGSHAATVVCVMMAQ